MSAHWGTLPAKPLTSPADKSGNTSNTSMCKESIMKARCMEVEGPELHQPSAKHYPPVNEYVVLRLKF